MKYNCPQCKRSMEVWGAEVTNTSTGRIVEIPMIAFCARCEEIVEVYKETKGETQ